MSSLIKGGGKAVLSPEAEEMIVSLLYDSRDRKNPLLQRKDEEGNSNDDDFDDENTHKLIDEKKKGRILFCELSDHDKKKERKKFIKRLVKCHNQQVLAMKLNGMNSETLKEEFKPGPSIGKTGTAIGNNICSRADAITLKPKLDKVRIDIVEAIFKDTSSNSKDKRSPSKSKRSKDAPTWREGTRKTIVLARSTNIKEFMMQCKSKLKMKKPTRVFIFDKQTSVEMEMTTDLSGLDDGAVVYVSSHEVQETSKEMIYLDRADELEIVDEDVKVIDPLENVKKAYIVQHRNRIKDSKRRFAPIQSHKRKPSFSSCLDNLEEMSESRSSLPAANYRSKFLLSLDSSRVVVVCGATGCGKSTQIPQFILEGMKAIGCESITNILVTQPRRVAATSLAMRVSNERCSPSPGREGSEVGYNVRLSQAVSNTTKITYCTVGVLLRMLVNAPDHVNDLGENNRAEVRECQNIPLSNISHIIIDEVHERDLNTDFALTLLRPLLVQNEHIKIVLMSATASSDLFVNYFRSSDLNIEPKLLKIPGRTFPVTTKWLVECEKIAGSRLDGWNNQIIKQDCDDDSYSFRAMSKIDNNFIVRLIESISVKELGVIREDDSTKKSSGAILVFLPGKGEIQSLMQTLLKHELFADRKNCFILQLHSTLSPQEQWMAFQPVNHGVVKIVLATNVAETSITIPDVSIVIDTGRVKESRFNSSTRIKELVTVWTSQASAIQRAGRAGRTGPGICYKLYSEEFTQQMMLPQTPPEIVRTPLEELVLQVCLLKEKESNSGTSPMKFLSMAPEPPAESRLHEACDHLLHIGALTSIFHEDEPKFRLTPLGYHLSHLPMDPKVGKILVVGCVLKCIEPALTIAASLSCSKSCWLTNVPGANNRDNRIKTRELQEDIVRNGFGGEKWPHGTVKGDLIGVIAAYNAWFSSGDFYSERRKFANRNGLDNNVLCEIMGLRKQFKDALIASGLWFNADNLQNDPKTHNMDALLTSCCLVAGLYPNIATLMRPCREKKISSGRLITKDGDSCLASSNSFQMQRINKASPTGKDVYAVYHSKHRTVGTMDIGNEKVVQQIFLSDINFVSRYAILLFGGEIEVTKNYIVVDKWLKFKIVDESKETGEKNASQANAILIQELRNELDNVMLKQIIHEDSNSDAVIEVVKKLLVEG